MKDFEVNIEKCNRLRLISVCLSIFILNCYVLAGQNRNYNNLAFKHLSSDDGLSQRSITDIIQDNKGYLWFGTRDGLNKYDGYKITIYRHQSDDINSLTHSWITSIYEDNNNNLWIGTKNGLNRYVPEDDNFIQYKQNSGLNSLADNTIWSIGHINDSVVGIATNKGLNKIELTNYKVSLFGLEFKSHKSLFEDNRIRGLLTTRNGNLWLCSVELISVFNPQNNSITEIRYPIDLKTEIQSNRSPTLFEDTQTNIWLGYDEGLAVFNKESKKFETFKIDNQKIINSAVRTICQDSYGNLWVGTYNGLYVLNLKTKQIFHAKHDKDNPKSLSQNSIYKIIMDSRNNIWIGTWAGGVNYYDGNYGVFKKVMTGDAENMINYNVVSAIVEDKHQNLWIGTEGGGINYYDRATGKISYYTNNANDEKSISSNNVKSIIKDKTGNLWIGTHDNGLNFLNTEIEPYEFVKVDPFGQDGIALSKYNITSLHIDDLNSLWIGTLSDGLLNYNLNTKKLIKLNNISKSIHCIIKDMNLGFIIVGDLEGIEKVNISTLKHERIDFARGEISKDLRRITCVYIDTHGVYWIGTGGNGLFSYDSKLKKLVKYGVKEGLPNDYIYGILQDDKESLWISTNQGISQFDMLTKTFKNFTQLDGLQGNEFNSLSYLKTSTNEIVFGGVNGITIFNPNKILKNSFVPTIDIYEIKVNHQSFARITDKVSKITLKHNQNNFIINFTAPSFSQPDKTRFAYKLEGFDEDWVYVGNNKTATYANIKEGEYVFRVKAGNNDGVWNETGKSLIVKIRPALGFTWWAYLLYSLLILSLVWYIRTLVLARIEGKKQVQQERLEKEKIAGINKLKLKFFTNISHDFKTPLSLILGPLQNVIDTKGNSPETQYQLGIIQRNTLTLLELINQLLNFRKIEEGEMKLNPSKNNMVAFIENIKLSFDELARHRNISFHFTHDVDKIDVWFDLPELKKVIINILSNAFKFTPTGGEITINLQIPSHNRDSIEISLKDNGVGIPEDKIKYIYDRYFQLGVTKGKRAGTGLGLSLSKDIIELHKGSIQVLSEEGKGALFSINLPLGKKHLKLDERNPYGEDLEIMGFGYNNDMLLSEFIENDEEIIQTINDINLPTILLVEDNIELRKFIKLLLDKEFNVLEANNGEAGLNLARNESVDLIISDVMMPIMSGIDLCNRIKSDIKTSHIPVLLLTAKASVKAQKEGYFKGADIYIPKPFDAQLLKQQVTNLINLRKRAINKFKKDALLTPKELTNVSLDTEFLIKAFKIVEENMSDNNFNAQEFTEKMGVSRTLLFNKLKSLTGQSLTEFIRSVRLKKAAQYLVNTEMNISEIAYDVGFNDLKYFRTKFKNMYNSSASKYRKTFVNKTN